MYRKALGLAAIAAAALTALFYASAGQTPEGGAPARRGTAVMAEELTAAPPDAKSRGVLAGNFFETDASPPPLFPELESGNDDDWEPKARVIELR